MTQEYSHGLPVEYFDKPGWTKYFRLIYFGHMSLWANPKYRARGIAMMRFFWVFGFLLRAPWALDINSKEDGKWTLRLLCSLPGWHILNAPSTRMEVGKVIPVMRMRGG